MNQISLISSLFALYIPLTIHFFHNAHPFNAQIPEVSYFCPTCSLHYSQATDEQGDKKTFCRWYKSLCPGQKGKYLFEFSLGLTGKKYICSLQQPCFGCEASPSVAVGAGDLFYMKFYILSPAEFLKYILFLIFLFVVKCLLRLASDFKNMMLEKP